MATSDTTSTSKSLKLQKLFICKCWKLKQMFQKIFRRVLMIVRLDPRTGKFVLSVFKSVSSEVGGPQSLKSVWQWDWLFRQQQVWGRGDWPLIMVKTLRFERWPHFKSRAPCCSLRKNGLWLVASCKIFLKSWRSWHASKKMFRIKRRVQY